jgi:nucleotide-binding universal stress UspA family protein
MRCCGAGAPGGRGRGGKGCGSGLRGGAVGGDGDRLNGFASQELVAASHVADMLVIGSRGQLGFPALRVSAIATKVAHYSTCPVVIVPPAS